MLLEIVECEMHNIVCLATSTGFISCLKKGGAKHFLIHVTFLSLQHFYIYFTRFRVSEGGGGGGGRGVSKAQKSPFFVPV